MIRSQLLRIWKTLGRYGLLLMALSAGAGAQAPQSPLAHHGASAQDPSGRCSALLQLALPATTIVSATAMAPGPFQARSMSEETQLPAYCRIEGRISPEKGSEIRFEVWMPLTGWNGRLYGAGNGGFAGTISYSPGLVEAIQRNSAGVSTDTGHASPSIAPNEDGSWALGRPERITDFGHRALHLATINAKAIISAFFGRPANHAYFTACSNGGRQGLMEAQRYPEDYDGIIAGAPAYHFTALAADFIWNWQALAAPGVQFPASKVRLIQSAVLKACTSGTAGYVQDPEQCRFDPRALLCGREETDQCLTAPQVDALARIYSGPRTANGKRLYPGFAPSGGEVGSEPGSGWDGWIFPTENLRAAQPKYANGLLRYFVSGVQTDLAQFNFDTDYPPFEQKLAPLIDATDSDLGRFAARGGKLILWHGWADPAVPPKGTIDYASRVDAKLGLRKSRDTMRLFMVPGVQHCFGGPGPNSLGQFTAPSQPADARYDMAAALERWVEKGIAPEHIWARHSSDSMAGALDWRRADSTDVKLVCAYPKVAVAGELAGQEHCFIPSKSK